MFRIGPGVGVGVGAGVDQEPGVGVGVGTAQPRLRTPAGWHHQQIPHPTSVWLSWRPQKLLTQTPEVALTDMNLRLIVSEFLHPVSSSGSELLRAELSGFRVRLSVSSTSEIEWRRLPAWFDQWRMCRLVQCTGQGRALFRSRQKSTRPEQRKTTLDALSSSI